MIRRSSKRSTKNRTRCIDLSQAQARKIARLSIRQRLATLAELEQKARLKMRYP
jgi:hypothetical protein